MIFFQVVEDNYHILLLSYVLSLNLDFPSFYVHLSNKDLTFLTILVIPSFICSSLYIFNHAQWYIQYYLLSIETDFSFFVLDTVIFLNCPKICELLVLI